MKCMILIYVIGLTICGCSSGFEQKSGDIRVQFQNGTVKEYQLLAVRQTSLLVGTKHHPEAIPLTGMSRIFAKNNAKTTWAIAGGLIGLSGLIVTYGIIHNDDPKRAESLFADTGFVGMFPPMIIGAAIGYLLADDEDEFDPSKPEHLKELREFSAYPFGEPPELYNVR